MVPTEYRFSIDAFRPDTLPMKRLAEYLADLAKLLGSESDVHFERIEPGSVQAVASVEEHARVKVAGRVNAIRNNDAAADVLAAFKSIDDKLAEDNATGFISAEGKPNIIKFPGRNRPKPIDYPAFNEPAYLEGVLTSLGGADAIKHAQLIDGDIKYTGLQTKNLELLSRLKEYLWGQPIRLIGRGRFQRLSDGSWEMKTFLIDDFEAIEQVSFDQTIARLRGVPDGVKVTPELLRNIRSARNDESE